MTPNQMNETIEEIEHMLAVEHMVMTSQEKENLRKVSRGELTYSELRDMYIAQASSSQTSSL